MGEFGDALSTAITSQTDQKPSIFEVLAQDGLNRAIRPAVKHIVRVLAQNNPQQFGWCLVWYNELFSLMECVVQHHFLSIYAASYAEYYYDMKRVAKTSDSSSFDKRVLYLSLASLTIFPYVQEKFDQHYNFAKEKSAVKGFQSLNFIERTSLFCYPYLHFLWNSITLYYNFLYAIGKSEFHSPFLKILKLHLVYVNPFDAEADSQSSTFARFLTKLLTGGVHVGVFALQFIDWWFDENNNNSIKDVMKEPLIEPPSKVAEKTNIPVPANHVCPLCNRQRINDTALMTSGYVFCYVCIFQFVKKNNRCPVTGYKTTTSHLIKIYPPT